MKTNGDWKEFEKAVKKLHDAFYPDATVKHDEKIRGQNSNKLRQIDVTVRQTVGLKELLIIVECKKQKRRVGVSTVESFVGMREDVRADVAIMVSSSGFTDGAVQLAKTKMVSIYTFRDTENEMWPNGLRVPFMLDLWIVKPTQTQLVDGNGTTQEIPLNSNIRITRGNEIKTVKVSDLIRESWMNLENPEEKLNGELEISVWPETRMEGKFALKCHVTGHREKFVREGRFHFLGLIDQNENIAHSKEFRIDVGGPAFTMKEGIVPTDDEGGFGLELRTVLLEGNIGADALVLKQLCVDSLSITAGAEDSLEIPLD